jgi:hypothetical protein
VRPEAEADYNDRVQARMQRTVWLRGGCQSWYLDPNGRNVTLWPSFTFQYRAATARFDRDNYDVVPATEHSSEPEKVAA